jgi:hypothetical protein
MELGAKRPVNVPHCPKSNPDALYDLKYGNGPGKTCKPLTSKYLGVDLNHKFCSVGMIFAVRVWEDFERRESMQQGSVKRSPLVRFTGAEAREKIGKRVRSLTEFAGVPTGTSGTVIDVHEFDSDSFDVVIKWDLTRRQNFKDRFAKGPYEEFLREETTEFAVAL